MCSAFLAYLLVSVKIQQETHLYESNPILCRS
nr:MAG TPA: hypothetical protein [Caudoviricetes sp.]